MSIEPTAISITPTPLEEPTATVVPPTSAPTPLVPNTDTLAALSSVEAATLEPGAEHQYTFTYAVTTPRTGTDVHVELRAADGSIASGWTLRAQAGQDGWTSNALAVDVVESGTLAPNATFTLTIVAQAPPDAPVEQTVSLFVSSMASTVNDVEIGVEGGAALASLTVLPPPTTEVVDPPILPEARTASVGTPDEGLIADGTAPPGTSGLECPPESPVPVGSDGSETFTCSDGVPEAGDLQLACGPDVIASSVGGASVEATCTLGGRDTLVEREVTLTELDVIVPRGWTVMGDGAGSGSTFTHSANQTIGAGATYTLSFVLTPGVCDTASGTVAVSSSFTHEGSGPLEGPSTTFTAESVPVPALLPAIDAGPLDFGATAWSGTGYPTQTAGLAITISELNDGGCAGMSNTWTIQVGTDGLYGANSNQVIPADSLTYLGTQSSADPPAGLIPVGHDVQLTPGGKTTIATGIDMIGGGGIWHAAFELDPPEGMPPDRYTGTVTLEILNVP